MRRERPQPRGYVLVTVLVLVLIAGLAAAAAVRHSMDESLSAQASLRDVQYRWGALTLERALLPSAGRLIEAYEEELRRPVAARTFHVALGQLEFEVRLEDEQAKVNAGRLLGDVADLPAAERKLRELLSGTDAAGRVRVRGATPDAELPRLGSYAQIVEQCGARELFRQNDVRGDGLADRLTCWGDGRLNVYRASPASLRWALSPAVDLARVQELAALRDQVPRLGLSQMLDRLELTDAQRHHADGALTERSRCHSVWTVARSRGFARFRLSIADASGSAGTCTWEW